MKPRLELAVVLLAACPASRLRSDYRARRFQSTTTSMAGLRADQGVFDGHQGDPTRDDADLDPSFPLQASTWSVPLPDIFAAAPVDPLNWLRTGPTPQYGRLLHRSSVDGLRGPWILLHGFLEQGCDIRRVFTFLQGMLVSIGDVEPLERAFQAIRYPGNSAIPRPSEDHYTFAGEIPWSPRFGSWLRHRDGRARRNTQRAFARWSRGGNRGGFRLEIPAHDFSWAHTYGALNENTGADVPAPALCEALGLVNHARRLDLYDAAGRPASLYRRVCAPTGARTGSGTLLYIRRGLLRRYLRMTNQRMVWMVWGEREFKTGSGLYEQPDIRVARGDYQQIHRRFQIL